ncbi:hypothetical protein [Halocatena pleomorpha]|uniref:Uncharacterized protein n=1 Tax=Halocatena pleomorpha TaxID=1785090 RepID=A0A3P3RL75_9EURY|nr:hypothetical protein [Halocatena pleomorpha]RRJ33143.1 hypothetical protein EIK79_03720 [Halocatena pleomorpha]
MSDRMWLGGDNQGDPRVQCHHCDRGFDPQQAYRIIVHESMADYTCPWCQQTVSADPPLGVIERPPSIVNTSCTIDDDGLHTARLFFEGGAWLQFRETDNGWVREEMFTPTGEEYESFATEFDREDCDPPVDYLNEEANRYTTYTKAGLRIQRPHIAAVLLKR